MTKILKQIGIKTIAKKDNLRIFGKGMINASEKKINVLYTVVGLNHKARRIYKTKIKNFIVTYIDADIKEIIKLGKKKTYKNKKNILGVDIVPEYPKNPDFIIKNNMKTNLKSLATNYFEDIKKFIYK